MAPISLKQNKIFIFQAFNLASKWVLGNYMVYQKTGHMWEKVGI